MSLVLGVRSFACFLSDAYIAAARACVVVVGPLVLNSSPTMLAKRSDRPDVDQEVWCDGRLAKRQGRNASVLGVLLGQCGHRGVSTPEHVLR